MEKGKLNRRDFLRLSAAAATGAIVAACKPAVTPAPTPVPKVEKAEEVAKPTPPPKEVITLTYWHGWTEQWEQMVVAHCEAFHEKYPDIQVNEVVVPSGELDKKLMTAVAAGNPPDAMTTWGSFVALAAEEAILPLNDYMDLGAVKEWVDPWAYQLGEWEGKLYGLPYWAGSWCLIWNKNLFALAGLDPEEYPETTTDLDELTEKLTTYDSRGNIDRMGFLPTWIPPAVPPFGGKLYDYETRKITANDPKVVEALEWVVSYSKQYDIKKVQAFQSGLASERAAALDPLISAKFAMQIHGPWKLGDFRKYGDAGVKFGVAPHPVPPGEEGPATWVHGDLVLVPNGTKHPEAAAKFVMFTAGVGAADDYAQLVTFDGVTHRPINVPVSSRTLDHPDFKKVVEEYPGYDVFINTFFDAKRAESIPRIPVDTYYMDRLDAVVEAARLLEKTPKEALDEVTKEVQDKLNKWYEERG